VNACTGNTVPARTTNKVQSCDQVRLRKRSSPPLERLGQKHSFDTDDEESTSAVDDPTHSVTTTMAGDHYSDVVPLPEGIVSKLSSELSESSESSRHSYHKVQQSRAAKRSPERSAVGREDLRTQWRRRRFGV
jgi:hypothetical protein